MFEKNRKAAEAAQGPLPPSVDAIIKENMVFPSQPRFSLTLEENTPLLATVTNNSTGRQFLSDIRLHAAGTIKCTCGKPGITGLPCEHIEFHVTQCGMTTDQVVPPCRTTKVWKEGYGAAMRAGGFGAVSTVIIVLLHAFVRANS